MKYLVFCFLTILLFSVSCSKSSPLACSTWALEITDEAAALSEAQQAYANDDSPANCRAYRNALQNYLDELESFRSCSFIGADRADWDEFVKESQEDIDDLDC